MTNHNEWSKDLYEQSVSSRCWWPYDAGWNGDLQGRANDGETFDWLGVADGGAAGTASLLGFYTSTDAAGQLKLDFTISAGNFGGIARRR